MSDPTQRPPMRFPEARAQDPAVAQWLQEQPGPLGARAREAWEALGRSAQAADPRWLMHDGMATLCLGDAALAYVAVYRAHANLGLFHATALPDPQGLLQGTGRFMRHVRLTAEAPLPVGLDALLAAAVCDLQQRRRGR